MIELLIAESLQQCEEEKDLQYDKIQLSHWNKMCETCRVFVALSSSCHCSLSYRRALLRVKRQKTFVPIVVWLGFDPFRPFIITLVAELGIQPLIRSIWTETSAITQSTFSISVIIFPSSTYGGDLSWSVDGACIVALPAQCTRL